LLLDRSQLCKAHTTKVKILSACRRHCQRNQLSFRKFKARTCYFIDKNS